MEQTKGALVGQLQYKPKPFSLGFDFKGFRAGSQIQFSFYYGDVAHIFKNSCAIVLLKNSPKRTDLFR
jgi:hypothetical protein